MAATLDSVFQRLDSIDSPVELMILGCTEGESNGFANALRNAGQAVHIKSANDRNKLAQLLETEPCDLVLINCNAKSLPLAQAVDSIRAINPSASLILLSQDPSKQLAYLVEEEARDLLHIEDTARLAFAIKREHQTLLLRQQLALTRHKLLESENRCNTLIGSSRDAIAYVHEGMHIRGNSVYVSMFGFDGQDDIEGLPVMDMVAPDARVLFKRILRTLDEEGNHSHEVLCQDTSGTTFSAVMEFSPASIDGEDCTQILIRDRSKQQQLEDRIDELSQRDVDTGLYNRRAFMERIEQQLTSSSRKKDLGLINLSISNFHDIRENAGVEATDQILLEASKALTSCVSKNQTLARFGDHDFMLICPTGKKATEVAEHCLQALKHHPFAEQTSSVITPLFSVGVTRSSADEVVSIREFINRACQATKQAGDMGDNQLVLFNPQLSQSGNENRAELDESLVDLIDQALENDQFRLLYQPIVSLQGDTRENYSILLRLLNRQQEEIVPNVFLPQAERASRMAEIDRWVIRNAIRELSQQRKNGKKINFHIILSLPGIEDESILLWICDCLREFKAKGPWLVFQFDEHILRKSIQSARQLIEGLKKINCRISINHFTEGSNNDALLKHLPIDIVKLAPSFMENLSTDPKQQQKLQKINDQLQKQGLKTVACGVEDANSLAMLWHISVNYIQGYFLQEPSSSINFDNQN